MMMEETIYGELRKSSTAVPNKRPLCGIAHKRSLISVLSRRVCQAYAWRLQSDLIISDLNITAADTKLCRCSWAAVPSVRTVF